MTAASPNHPFIITASRATDIPAFYGQWAVDCFEKGRVRRINPYNGKSYEISLNAVKCVVFWTKNPEPFMEFLDYFDGKIKSYYFQFTLNDYPANIEPNVPALEKRIAAFASLSNRLGRERVVWRFDPLMVSDICGPGELIDRVLSLHEKLKSLTSKLVFSFANIDFYRKVRSNMRRHNVPYRSWTEDEISYAARRLGSLAEKDFEVASCAEPRDLSTFGISHNACVDAVLIEKIAGDDELRTFLAKKNNSKDSGQRRECLCARSADIGAYSTCPHLCRYCYANSSDELAVRNHDMIIRGK